MRCRIRSANPTDAETLVGLIHRLAEYEALVQEAAPEAEALAEHLSGEGGPRCEALLAEVEEPAQPGDANAAADRGEGVKAVGFALFFPSYSTFRTNWGLWLEDLFVEPDYRRRGIGRALLRRVGQIAVARGCARLEWTVLDWNEPAIGFYRQLGARAMDEWTTMRLEGEALRSLGGAPPG